MNELNLYSIIEQDLDFKEEISKLYDAYYLLINQIEPSTLIDIGCGQGDFLIPIQNDNTRVFGIDLSSEQIKICKQKNINSSCIDICDVKEKFDCATAVFDVLNYIKQDNLKSFIQSTYNSLNTNAYFIFDINSLFGFQEVAQGTLSINKKDKFISIDAYFENNKLNTNITLFLKQKNDLFSKEENTITQYYHSNNDLENILKDIGFNIENIIKFKLHDTNEADKFIFVCKK